MAEFDLTLSVEKFTERLNAIGAPSELEAVRQLITIKTDELSGKLRACRDDLRQLDDFITSAGTPNAAMVAVEKAKSVKEEEMDKLKEESERVATFARLVEQFDVADVKSKGAPIQKVDKHGSVDVPHFLRAARGNSTLLAAFVERALEWMELSHLKAVADAMGIKYGDSVTDLQLKDGIRLTQGTLFTRW